MVSENNAIKFNCLVCNRDERLDPDWLHHVASLGHQRTLTRRSGGGHGEWGEGESMRERAIKISGCQRIRSSPFEILQYLSKFGKIDEFVCPTSITGTKPEHVYCLFTKSESVSQILKIESHQFYRMEVKITRKYTSPLEEEERSGSGNYSSEPLPLPASVGEVNNGGGDDIKLEDQLEKLLNGITVPAQKRAKLVKDIEDLLKQTFNNLFVFSYGSDFFLTSGLEKDPVRICIDPYGTLGVKTQGVIKESCLLDEMTRNMIFQILSTHQKKKGGEAMFNLVSLDPSVPEISLYFENINCKLRFENFLPVQKARLLRFLNRHDVRFWPLITLLRYWGTIHNVFIQKQDDDGYILILLMVFYLTRMKIVPPIIFLNSLATTTTAPPLVINNINVAFDTKQVRPTKISIFSDGSIRTLSTLATLQGFFKYFATRKLEESVICTTMGQMVPRNNFKPEREKDLPEAISNQYRFYANGDFRTKKLNIEAPMCLQDPFDLTLNVTEDFPKEEMLFFKFLCAKSVDTLELILHGPNKPNISSLFKVFNSNKRRTDQQVDEDDTPIKKPKGTAEEVK